MTIIETAETGLTVHRTIDAPRERVYRAYLDPVELTEWFAPGSLTPEVHALDPEPGGPLSVSFVDEENRTDLEGTFVEMIENERIVHTWNYPGEEGSPVTWELRDVDGGTEVTLTHEDIDPYRERSAAENVDGYVEGWTSALEKLDVALEET